MAQRDGVAAVATAAAREYIDPNTGQLVRTLEDDQAELLPAYNPAEYPDLPITPHTKWARPLAGGKLRILFVAPHGFYEQYSMIREAVELWQRLDCDILVTNQPDPRVMSQDFDVIAVTLQGFTNGRWAGWSDLDPKLREWILERLKSGKSGLVWAYPTAPNEQINALLKAEGKQPASELLRGFPAEALPQANGEKGPFRWDRIYDVDDSYFLRAADTEKLVEIHAGAGGRALVKLNYQNAGNYPSMGLTPDSITNSAATDAQYDQWMALAARAMLLAAGREPQAKITAADVSGSSWSVTLAGNGLEKLKLTARARDMWGRTLLEDTTLPASARVTVKAVKLPPRNFAEFILHDGDGKVVDWFNAAAPPATDPKITAVTLDRPHYAIGQTVQGEVSVEATNPAQCALTVYLTDHEGRRIRQAPGGRIAAGKAAFSIAIPASSDSLLMRVEVLLSQNGTLADALSADVPVPQVQARGFFPIMYGPAHNRFSERNRRRMFRDQFGVKGGFHQGKHSFANLASQNLASIEYGAHLGYPMKQTDCEEFAENWETNYPKWLLGEQEKMVPYRPLFYSLGEEHFVLLSACPTPTANAKFREWLQGKYGTLERLNEVWGAKFGSWDEITMITPEIVDMLKIEFGVVRFENRRFMEHLFAARHAFLAEHFRKVDPLGGVGIHAGWDLWMGRGYDYWLLSRGMDDMMCYGGTHNHYARSFFDRYWGSHYHYSIGSIENVRWHPWYMVLSGARAWSWYTDAPQIWGAATADLQLGSDFAASAHEFKAAAEAGELLSRLKYQDDQVAIHYSQDSFQAGVSDLTWMHQRFVNLFFDTGTPFHFVSYEQVEQGELLKRRPKLLVLPHSVALSEAECRAIREYVQQGGVVWADVMPGTYNNFGQKLEKSQLADLFEGLAEIKLENGAVMGKPVGKGHVILEDPGNYSYARNVGRAEKALGLYGRVMETAKVVRPASLLKAESGQPASGIWMASWTNGSALHVAAAKDYQLVDREPEEVRLCLNRAGHVYEMRSGQYLGQTEDVAATLEPTAGQVFTVLPYRVRALALQAGRAQRGQDLVINAALRAEGQVGKDDLNVLQVRVTDPSGREMTALRRTIEMRGGRAQIALPLAVDEAPGKWTVEVRDLATGVKQTVGVELR